MSTTRKKIQRTEPSPAIKAHFSSPPWAAALLTDPSLIPLTNEAQTLRPGTTAETFLARTLSTASTIRAWQPFYSPSSPSSPHSRDEHISLLSLGSGVNGYPDTCHGGFVSLLLDEIVGAGATQGRPQGKAAMTARLEVDYRAPVRTPGVVLGRSWLEKVEGRKVWAKGTIEDGAGNVLAEGRGLFIIVEAGMVAHRGGGKL